MNKKFKRYLVFWFSQALSQMGSSMTGFALILWAYSQKGTAMTISLMSFFNYLPYILVSVFAGTFVDRHRKKTIMLVTDSIAALCSAVVLVLIISNRLDIWHIYAVNFIIGFMNAFQGPASAVAIAKIVPKEKLEQVSGMNSFSSNLVAVLAPVVSASLFGLVGLRVIIAIDLCTFAFAFFVLLLVLRIPEDIKAVRRESSVIADTSQGFHFLRKHKAVFMTVITLAILNFFSRLTYENILSPMILARSGNSNIALGIVNAIMGIGGVIGGILVASGRIKANHAKMIYLSAFASFLLGDITMAVGKSALLWALAGMAASLPIPFITAGSNMVLYEYVPEEMQGRIFSVRNAIQFSTIPIGILLGGFLADHVFEPFMMRNNTFTSILRHIVGSGDGSGMAVMFLCTGILGSMFSLIMYKQKDIRKFEFVEGNMNIRVMTIDDYDKVYELWMSCKNMGFNDLDDSREGIHRFLRRNPQTSFVAEEKERIVGIVLSGHDGRRGYIYHMSVAEDRREIGIATRLLEECLAALKSEGINKVALLVFNRNEIGNAFWESHGFEVREDVAYRNKALAEIVRIDT